MTSARSRAPRVAVTAACLAAAGAGAAWASEPVAQADGGQETGGQEATAAASRQESALSLRARRHVLAGRPLRIAGALRPGPPGRRILVQVRRSERWTTAARASTRSDGSFSAAWVPSTTGRHRVRARYAGDERTRPAVRSLRGTVNAYRAAAASWYGPGLYGNRTACGQTLSPSTFGVANKSLPCGTRVTFHYKGRTVTAPVVDRGPFVGDRTWDLTAAAKRKLGFGSTGNVWATR